MNTLELQKLANRIRYTTFKAIANAGGGHFGGCMSIIEILTSLFFGEVLRIDPKNIDWKERDRFVLAKGHGGPALYVTLMEKGVIPWEWLQELDANGGRLPKHVDRLKTPGIEASTGPLGQGLSMSIGMALGLKLDDFDSRVYVLLSDGDCNEGQLWEAAMTASKYKLDNLTAIIDRNGMQIDGPSDDVMPMEPLTDKWHSFGWNVLTADGHNLKELLSSIDGAKKTTNKPTVIIAKTIKGKGVPYMEDNYIWHSGSISKEQYEQGITHLESLL